MNQQGIPECATEARLKTSQTPRRPLGDVSPNVSRQKYPPIEHKQQTTSPLKRSLTASIETGHGLQYLKKRKLSHENPLSQVMTARYSDVSSDERTRHDQTASQPPPENRADTRTLSNDTHSEADSPTDLLIREDTEDSTNDQRSFSSLINFEPSSQPAASTERASQTQPRLLFSGPSYAELLRLRLRVAMFKVRTGQTHVTFDNLEIKGTLPAPNKTQTLETKRNLARQHGQTISGHAQVQAPVLLEAPILLPTLYSSRMGSDSSVPSSPAQLPSPEKLPLGRSPDTPDLKKISQAQQELTSSIVKGRVAEGLLGLRNAK